MAVSNEFVAIALAMTFIYFALLTDKIRWKRMVGAAGFITCGIVTVVIGDNIPMFLLFGISIIIGGIQLLQDVTEIVT